MKIRRSDLKKLVESLIKEMDIVSQCKKCGEDFEGPGENCSDCDDGARVISSEKEDGEEKEKRDIRRPQPGLGTWLKK